MINFLSFTDAFWQKLNIKKGDRPKILIQTVPSCFSTKLQGGSGPNFAAFSFLILKKTILAFANSYILQQIHLLLCCFHGGWAISFCTILMPMHVFSNLKAHLRKCNNPLFRKSFVAWYLYPTRPTAMLSLKSVISAREGPWQGERSLANNLAFANLQAHLEMNF